MCMMIIVLWFSYMDGCMSKTSCEEVYNVSMLVFPKGLILSNRFLMLKIMQNLFCLYEYISLMYLSITKWARFDLLFQGSLSEVFDRGEDSFLLIEISFNLMKINDFLLIHFFLPFWMESSSELLWLPVVQILSMCLSFHLCFNSFQFFSQPMQAKFEQSILGWWELLKIV